jgi:hypothetical protein
LEPDNHFITAIESANAPTFFTNRDQTWGEIFATTVENGPVKLWKADGTSTPIATPIQKSEGTMDVNFFNKGQTLVTTVNKENSFTVLCSCGKLTALHRYFNQKNSKQRFCVGEFQRPGSNYCNNDFW